MALNQFLQVLPNGKTPPRETAAVLINAMQGKLNCLFQGTLTANAASTTFTGANTPGAEKVGPESFIDWMATTANAAAEKGGTAMYVTARSKGSVTIAHANNAQADRTFIFLVIG
jgi:hypothetical protein